MRAADRLRLVVEDAAEMLAVGEHFGLRRQIGAAGIDQIDAGQPVLARDLLRAQMLLHRHRVIGAALDGGVVGDDHAFAALDAADAGDDAGGVHRAVVHAVGGQRRQFQERRAGIDQVHHPVARQQLAARDMALARLLVAAAAPPRRGAPAILRPARACARHWRGTQRSLVSTDDPRIAKGASPYLSAKVPRRELRRQWRANAAINIRNSRVDRGVHIGTISSTHTVKNFSGGS